MTNYKEIIHYCDVRNMEAQIQGRKPLSMDFLNEVFRLMNRGELCTLPIMKEKFPLDTKEQNGWWD
jgi:hypothetical protein